MISGSIVLYHNSPEIVKKVIDSFLPQDGRELFLVDNSEEKTDIYENIPHVTYIHTGENRGYGAGHNIGIKKAIEIGSAYHVVMNPDLCFSPSVLDTLTKYADSHEDVVYLLPRVEYPDGSLQYLCKLAPTPADVIFRRFLPSSWTKKTNDRYCLKASGYNHIMNPPCLSGCFMFMRTETLKKYDLLFDERFFMYFEDFDLMRRLHRVGKTVFYPYETIVHDHGAGSYHSMKMLKIHIRSAVLYFNKYGWIFDKERKEMNTRILNEIAGFAKEGNA